MEIKPKKNWDALYIQEWRELGFYYSRDSDLKQWWLIGSKIGLSNFISAIKSYAQNLNNTSISEHIHLGPHQYLKIITLDKPEINSDHIGGSLTDLLKLSNLIEQKLAVTNVGSIFTIGSEYALINDYTIKFFVMDKNFDPSQIED